MTTIQVFALFVLIVLVGLTYWAGYRGGMIDGRIEGIDQGKAIQQAEDSRTIHDLKKSIRQAQQDHRRLFASYTSAVAAAKLGEQDRLTLLAIADQLRLAAETFSAFRTGKKLERDTLALRDQALVMAGLLQSVAQESAA